MSGFFQDEVVANKAADEPWRKSETDRMLDAYLGGMTPTNIAQSLGRNPKAVKRRLEQFTCNERDFVIRYEPRQRVSRKGKRFTQNETLILEAHTARNIGRADTARLLARPVDELLGQVKQQVVAAKGQAKAVGATTLDLIWAHRYIYFVWKSPVLTDAAYDALVQEEIEFGGGGKAFLDIKGQAGVPQHIRALAMYLVEREKLK